ncbi:hypothetical protein GCM10025868_13000 [Angustibacter aerolatus]|uniref:ATPase AAA-type core domain-containing protein n=1 Tax=Angustibacter aerolatus TaxID=1162965 RepID=A0ABQ6JGS2_9ACTN|nr:AAA family ATPase [Angustibacter aerolatus]GMA86050.1 hypothetical protein GCM10025868_13000 [Angustibacter aerolatus]
MGLPDVHVDPLVVAPTVFFVLLLLVMAGSMLGNGRSPHVVFRPEQIDVRLDDVVGIDGVKREVVRTLNLFLAHKTFATEMGGRSRRGVLFEGAPGTGKTHTAKALAREAGVPFLMATATSFQSGLQGASQRKVRSLLQGPAQGRPPARRRHRVHRRVRRDRAGPARHRDDGGVDRGGAGRQPAARLRRAGRPAHAGRADRPGHQRVHRRRRRPDDGQRACWCSLQSFEMPTAGERLRGKPGRRRQPRAAGAPPPARPRCPGAQHPAARLDEHRLAARPRAAAARPLRPAADLRPALEGRTPGARRPLPGAQGARPRARRRRAPRRARRDHHRLQPGDGRGTARRGPGARGRRRTPVDEPGPTSSTRGW